MRKTSRILSIVGSCLVIALGGLFVLGSLYIGPFSPFVDIYPADPTGEPAADTALFQGFPDLGVDVSLLVLGCAAMLVGILGILAGIFVTRRNNLSGALNIIAAVLSLPTIIASVLFILAAVFALNREKVPAPSASTA
jgi:hypothetical protein